MKINPAVLALLATTAAAVPMSAVDMIGRQVVTPAETTTAPSKTLTPASPNGPGGEHEVEPCVMPYGCRDEDKHAGDAWHPRTTTLDRGKMLSSTFGDPTTVFDPFFPLPTAEPTREVEPTTTLTLDHDKISSFSKSLVPTTTSRHKSNEPITEPILPFPTAKTTRKIGICIMPTGCKNATKHARPFETRTPSIATT